MGIWISTSPQWPRDSHSLCYFISETFWIYSQEKRNISKIFCSEWIYFISLKNLLTLWAHFLPSEIAHTTND